jgi:hypothetical protein
VLQRQASGGASPFGSLPGPLSGRAFAAAPDHGGLASHSLEAAAALLEPARIIEAASGPSAPAQHGDVMPAPGTPDLDSLVERACTRVFETLALEQERRGVSPWL